MKCANYLMFIQVEFATFFAFNSNVLKKMKRNLMLLLLLPIYQNNYYNYKKHILWNYKRKDV